MTSTVRLREPQNRAAACASASRSPRTSGCRPATRSRETRSTTWQPDASLAIQEAAGTDLHVARRAQSLTYDSATSRRTRPAAISSQVGVDFAGLGGDVQYIGYVGRGARLLSDHRQDHLRRPRHRRHHPGLGWPGRPPDRPLLQGRRDDPRLRPSPAIGPRDLNYQQMRSAARRYWATTAEIRFPLPFVPDDLGIQGAVFADAGSLFGAGAGAKNAAARLWTSIRTITTLSVCLADSSAIRSSVGASLMWNSPVGPLRMDFAKVLTKETYDQSSSSASARRQSSDVPGPSAKRGARIGSTAGRRHLA